MIYSLAPYVGRGHDADAFRPRGADQPWWRPIDLRPDATRRDGYALMVTRERIRERGVIHLGDHPDERWSMRALGSRLGVSLPRGNLRQAAATLLLQNSRADGTRWQPLWPETRRGFAAVYRIWLGGLLWEMPALAGGATIAETWTAANDAPPNTELTADHHWTITTGESWQINANGLTCATAFGSQVARCDTPLDTADQTHTLTLVEFTRGGTGVFLTGPCCRKANDTAVTFYCHQARKDGTTDDHRLRKLLNNATTELGTASVIHAANETLTVQANGSSIMAKRNDVVTVGPVTDTGITTGPHIAVVAASTHASNVIRVDNVSAADLEEVMQQVFRSIRIGGAA